MEIGLIAIVCLMPFLLIQKGTINVFDKEKTFAIRPVLAVLIVVCHASFIIPNVSIDMSWFTHVGGWACGMFFMMSGYGLWLQKDRIKETSFNQYIKKRCWPLVQDLLIATILFNVIALFTGYRTLDKICVLLQQCDVNNLLPYSWFIYVLFFLYFTAYVAFRTRTPIVWLAIVSFIAIILFRYLGLSFCWYNSLLSFVGGALCAKYKDVVRFRRNTQLLVMITILIVGIGLYLGKPMLEILFTPFIAFSIIMESCCLPLSKVPPPISLYTYLYQAVVLKLLLIDVSQENELIYVLSSVLACLLIGYLYYQIKRKMNKI